MNLLNAIIFLHSDGPLGKLSQSEMMLEKNELWHKQVLDCGIMKTDFS